MATSLMAPSMPPPSMVQSQWRAQSVELPVAGRSASTALSRQRPGSTATSRARVASGAAVQRPPSVQSCLSPRQLQAAPPSSQRGAEVAIATTGPPCTPGGTPATPSTPSVQASATGSPAAPRRMQSRPLRPNLRSSVPSLSQQQAPPSARQHSLSSRVASAAALTPQVATLKAQVTAAYPVSRQQQQQQAQQQAQQQVQQQAQQQQSSHRPSPHQALPLSPAETSSAARSSSPAQTRLSSNPARPRPQRSQSTRLMGAMPQRLQVQSSPRKVRSPLRSSEDHSPVTARSSSRADPGTSRTCNSQRGSAVVARASMVTSPPLAAPVTISAPSAPSRPRLRPTVTSPERRASPERCKHAGSPPRALAAHDLPLAASRAPPPCHAPACPACGTALPGRSPHTNGVDTDGSSGAFVHRASSSVQPAATHTAPLSPLCTRPGAALGATPSSPYPAVSTFLRTETGACSLKGLKAGNPNWVNQDTELVHRLSDELLLVGVFDGHGENGRIISLRVREIVEQFAQTFFVQSRTPLDGAFAQLFALSQSVLEREGLSRLSGTTATVALINQAVGSMAVAHAGDSKLMVIRDEKVTFETIDHVIDDEEERRITECGGEVRELPGAANAGVRRIFIQGQHLPGLAMARSLGDLEAHRLGALSEPTVTTEVELKDGSIVILASDGLWDRLPREFVMANVALAKPEQSAHAMAFAARARWPPEGDIDDITAVVVQLRSVEDSSSASAR